MSKCERKRSRSTNDSTIGGILGSMARAHEFVVGSRPRNNATQVRAHSVQTVAFEGLVFLDDKVAAKKDVKSNTALACV
jgi:hypothetical protein